MTSLLALGSQLSARLHRTFPSADRRICAIAASPVGVSADASGELMVSLPGGTPQRMQAWSGVWKVRSLRSGRPPWFAGDFDRGGATGSIRGVHLVA